MAERLRNGKLRLEDREFLFEKDKEVKDEFLNKIKPSTARTVKSILLKVDEYEQMIDKSVYDLDVEERDDLMISKFSNKSKGVIRSTLSYLRDYINFCIDKNLVRHRENRFTLIMEKDIEKYLNTQAMDMKYLSKEEIKKAQDQLVNVNDKLVLQLIPLGIRGRTELGNTNEELVNLSVKQYERAVKEGYLYVMNNDGDERSVPIDAETLDMIKQTIDQKFYLLNNGQTVHRKHKTKEVGRGIGEKVFVINPTPYVFRTAGKNKKGKVKYNYFNAKINMIKDWVENPYINITNLYFSGMIDYAMKLREEKGTELETEDYYKIIERFNYGKPRTLPSGTKDWGAVVTKVRTMVTDYIKIKGV